MRIRSVVNWIGSSANFRFVDFVFRKILRSYFSLNILYFKRLHGCVCCMYFQFQSLNTTFVVSLTVRRYFLCANFLVFLFPPKDQNESRKFLKRREKNFLTGLYLLSYYWFFSAVVAWRIKSNLKHFGSFCDLTILRLNFF